MSGMSEETTHNLSHHASFEDRVFARFDLIDTRLQTVEDRLQSVEKQAERRAFETKPIWEQALAEIGEVKLRMSVIETRLGAVEGRMGNLETLTRRTLRRLFVVNNDLNTLRGDQLDLESRLEKLEPPPSL